ncbi:MAG TPA: hydantoinase/oxoprolinase family protein [Gemmataceae bacterium]|nr:hydantoinase/oxoprolinase family protein [Gemmataceae bacterium]
MTRAVLGFDIGGANTKAAHSGGEGLSRTFALWKDPEGVALRPVLRELRAALPPASALAVTMTGELCDCFASKREGVSRILDAVADVAGDTPVLVWRTDGQLVELAAARSEDALLVAAANWHALATWAGRLVSSGSALLLDIGSTTTDIIPLHDRVPVTVGRTDPERLSNGELVYTGVRRTPVCAVLGNEGLAAEFFATTHDVHVALGLVPEDPSDTDTADRRPATTENAHARLARMVCADLDTSTEAERLALAREVHRRQIEQIVRAVAAVTSRMTGLPRTVILSGSGEFLAREVVAASPRLTGCRVVSLAERIGPALSQAACAYAVAVLAAERSIRHTGRLANGRDRQG